MDEYHNPGARTQADPGLVPEAETAPTSTGYDYFGLNTILEHFSPSKQVKPQPIQGQAEEIDNSPGDDEEVGNYEAGDEGDRLTEEVLEFEDLSYLIDDLQQEQDALLAAGQDPSDEANGGSFLDLTILTSRTASPTKYNHLSGSTTETGAAGRNIESVYFYYDTQLGNYRYSRYPAHRIYNMSPAPPVDPVDYYAPYPSNVQPGDTVYYDHDAAEQSGAVGNVARGPGRLPAANPNQLHRLDSQSDDADYHAMQHVHYGRRPSRPGDPRQPEEEQPIFCVSLKGLFCFGF
jgi:hypothetical protein